MYTKIGLNGNVLDVGGYLGTLRKFLQPGQRYINCDPIINAFENIYKRKGLIKSYPFLTDNVNFICCDAEFLPFKSNSFNTVNMRSVIDHFLNPELALLESYRVLQNEGILVVGLYVHGGKENKHSTIEEFKEKARSVFELIGINRFADHHVWHPSYDTLIKLISSNGFNVEQVFWQEGYKDTVCYIKARKDQHLRRKK